MEWIRDHCLGLPHATEQLQWGDHLVFKIGGKMFAITSLSPSPVQLTIKASEDGFAELTERQGIIPAPYMARAKWIAFETLNALSRAEIKQLIDTSYKLVLEKLPKKSQADLAKPAKNKSVKKEPAKNKPAKKKNAAKRKSASRSS
jgi:predicted DNA-binding protein (MmcQ/YjbR family)